MEVLIIFLAQLMYCGLDPLEFAQAAWWAPWKGWWQPQLWSPGVGKELEEAILWGRGKVQAKQLANRVLTGLTKEET